MLNTKHHINKVMGWAAICIALVILSLPAYAKETRVRVGSLKIIPGIKYKGAYQKNIFFESTNERNDFVQTFTPSIRFEYAGGSLGNYLNAGYDIDLTSYADYEDNNYQAHRPFISLGLENLGGFYLNIKESYVYTADPFGTANTYNVGTKTERWNNTVDVLLGRKLSDHYALELTYKNYVERFRENKDKWQDRLDHTYGITFLVKVASKTALFGQYRYTDAEYIEQNDSITSTVPGDTRKWNSSNSQDYYTNDFFIGARFHPTGRIRGEIKLGQSRKNYRNTIDASGNRFDDDDTWIVETDFQYVLLQKTTLSLNFYRSFLGSPDSTSTGYIDTKAGIGLTHKLNRTTFRLGFDWNANDYLNEAPGLPAKYFQLYTINAGIDYRISEWLTAGLNYKHQDKVASNDAYSVGEYSDDELSFSGGVTF